MAANSAQTASLFPHGEIRSIIIKVQHNCTSDRKRYGKLEDPPIKHEYCVVFRKPRRAYDGASSGGAGYDGMKVARITRVNDSVE